MTDLYLVKGRYSRRLTTAACLVLDAYGFNPFGQRPDERTRSERYQSKREAMRRLADVIDEGERDGVPT